MPGSHKNESSANAHRQKKDKTQKDTKKMGAPNKQVSTKRTDKAQHAKGFYEFLKDGNYMKDKLLGKVQLKNIYCMLYSPQFYPNVVPEFEEMVLVMQSLKIIQFGSDGRVSFHPYEDQSTKKTAVPTKKGQSNPPAKGHGSVHLAVDQRVALGSGKLFHETTSKKGHHCAICNKTLKSIEESDEHRAGKLHRSNFLIHWYNTNRKTLIQKKHNVNVVVVEPKECKVLEEEGLITLKGRPNEKKIIELKVENKGEKPVVVRHIEMLCHNATFQLQDEYGVTSGNKFVKIPPGLNYSLQVHCQNEFVGQYQAPIAFQIRREDNSELFHIVRDVILYVEFPGMEDLSLKTPFKSPHPVAVWPEHKDTVPGLEMPRRKGNALAKLISLENYWIPPKLNRLLNHGLKTFKGISDEENVLLQNTLKLLKEGLTPDNYSQYFPLLLHIEEHQMNVDIHHYDMQDVTMKTDKENKQLLTLEVPGLAEKRPSILRGDKLFVVIKDTAAEKSTTAVQYEGIVHFVRENEVVLGFNKILRDKYLPNMKFDVRFTFNRYPIQNQHRAVILAAELSLHKLMFPSASSASAFPALCDITTDFLPMNRMLLTNKEQRQAVRHIVAGSSRPAPYLVFGPPGTGKTVTVVEAMKQVWKKFPETHILACAPSNSASDLLGQRLLQHVPKSDIKRIYAGCHQWQEVPEILKDCSNYDSQQKHFTYPAKEVLMKYRVVITTLVTAGRLVSANFPQNHFTHVFIDECGHAMEPEAMIALAGILETSTGKEMGGQLVIAGDPKQLGPVLRSPIVLKHGLDVSLLERLMSRDLYQKDASTHCYNPLVLTKLIQNFRSHRVILTVPNALFYDDELQEVGDPLLIKAFCDWDVLPKRGFPMFFHGVIGKDQREGRSPSFFNIEEIMVIQYYVDELLQARVQGTRIQQKEIGVISPYSRQVQKVKQLFRKKNWGEVSVGSTEQFQGQERKVIIISTVRSNPDMLALDKQYKLGFLRNPKRFNVAITRAKALLIVIGNPHILCRDENWRTLINYCHENGAVTGSKFTMDATDRGVDDITQHFETLSLGPTSDEVEISKKELYEGPKWRSEM